MDRREFIRSLAGGLLAAPLAAEAQQAGKVPRVGVLSSESRSNPVLRGVDEIRQGLRELGYVEGQTIAIEYRWAEGKEERFPGLASELVHLKVDVIVATVAAAVRAAKHATKTIPIVMVVNDPVAAGFVATVARPGGNITGLSMMSPEVVGKHEIDRAFAAMARERADALLVLLDPILARSRQREQIVDLAARSHLPAMYALRLHVEAGGLMAYGANIFDLYRRAAIYVDKILKGAKPGDLPIDQPTKFELVINLKTAKALGLTIPPSLLQRADEVIQ
jgi:putative ABC transport system substrate-binding protein